MNSSFFLFLTLFVLCALTSTTSAVYQCTYTDTKGNFYDLSPLTKCDLSGWPFSNSDGSFVINFCQEVSGCNGKEAVCQDGTYGAGQASSLVFSDLANATGVTLTYPDGDVGTCPNGKARTSILNLECDPNATQPIFTSFSEAPTCQYNFNVKTQYACPKKVAPQQEWCVINVFLVPHTHDDVGWLQTIDGYYENQVHSIIDTSVAALVANPERKFIYVEQAFFTRWWYDNRTTDAQRQNVRDFVKQGRWEFVIGGWTMPDEACTTYGSMVDQLTLGHQFLAETFGIYPTKGWQIDPFGASTTTPTLDKLAGFNVQLIDRVTNKPLMQTDQRLQFWWTGSPSLGEKSKIFGEVMDGNSNAYCDWYSSFNFDKVTVTPDNVETYATKFINMVNSRKGHILTNNMLAAWGCDFQFQNAGPMFDSMDLVLSYIQKNFDTYRINVTYSTLSEYWDAVLASDVQWPENTGQDFFPYDDSLWWTGYFTSRTQLKGVVRQGEAVSHTVEPLYALGRQLVSGLNDSSLFEQLIPLRIANADATHHDGVTGTSVLNVVDMFRDDILNGISQADQLSSTVLSGLILSSGSSSGSFSSSPTTLLKLTDGQVIPVVISNGLGWSRQDFLNFPVNRNDLVVYDSAKQVVPSQISLADGVNSDNVTSTYRLFFEVKVEALGFQTLFIVAPTSSSSSLSTASVTLSTDVIENDYLSVTLDTESGRLIGLENKQSGLNLTVYQDLLKYISLHSGAYAFGPQGNKQPLTYGSSPLDAKVDYVVRKGPLVDEIHQTYPCDTTLSYAKQSVRLYHGNSTDSGNFVEMSFELGVLPSHTEIVTSFETPISNQGVFVSDDNGYEPQLRRTGYVNNIEGNYFPLVYSGYISDKVSQLTIVAERSHGATSVVDGQFEVMLHRNPDQGDGFGPSLTDTDVVFPVLRVLLDTPANSPALLHRQTHLLNFPPSTFFGQPATSLDEAIQSFTKTSGPLLGVSELPPNVHLLSLNAIDASSNTFLLRLTNVFTVDEDPILSQPTTVDVAKLLPGKITSFTETTLTGTQVIQANAPTTVTVGPKDIRTFKVELDLSSF